MELAVLLLPPSWTPLVELTAQLKPPSWTLLVEFAALPQPPSQTPLVVLAVLSQPLIGSHHSSLQRYPKPLVEPVSGACSATPTP